MRIDAAEREQRQKTARVRFEGRETEKGWRRTVQALNLLAVGSVPVRVDRPAVTFGSVRDTLCGGGQGACLVYEALATIVSGEGRGPR